jgi:hypothetical protein
VKAVDETLDLTRCPPQKKSGETREEDWRKRLDQVPEDVRRWMTEGEPGRGNGDDSEAATSHLAGNEEILDEMTPPAAGNVP